MTELDRAICEGDGAGFVKVSADRKGRILGASVVGYNAGEVVFPFVLAMTHGLRLQKLSATFFPYPTRMEAVKRVANEFQRARLEGNTGRVIRRVVSWLT